MSFTFKQIGNGIIFNGDCLEVMPILINQYVKVDAIITDIPYGTSACKWDSIIPLDKMWDCLKQIIYVKTPIALFSVQPFTSKLICSNIEDYKYSFYWEKDNSSNFLNKHHQPGKIIEDINIFGKGATSFSKKGDYLTYNPQLEKGKPYNQKAVLKKTSSTIRTCVKSFDVKNDGTRLPNNLIKFNRDKNKLHPTQKPVLLMEYLIKTFTNENDLVLDFTMGSGSTIVACQNLNRKFIGIELNKEYYNITKQRIMDLIK